MTRDEIDKLWQDLSNWKWGIIYRCAEDPRVIVPRRWRWGGWTLNFDHPRAGVVGLAAFALAVGPGILTHFLFDDSNLSFFVMLVSILTLVLWAHYEASLKY